MTNASDIVGYIFRADMWCIDCTGNSFRGLPSMFTLSAESTENILDSAAAVSGIDRHDESSFDSGDFPKVVFASQVEEWEHCGNCGDCIAHDLRDCRSELTIEKCDLCNRPADMCFCDGM